MIRDDEKSFRADGQQPAPTFAGQTVLLTGAANGIGTAVAHYFAARGATLAAVDQDGERLEALLAGLPAAGHVPIVGDVTDPETADRAVAVAQKISGTLEVLVNSAGIALLGSALNASVEDWNRVLAVNLTGTYLMARAAARTMLAGGYGRIINIASQAAVVALEDHAAYCASKAGVLGLTRVMSLEWAPGGVTVNAVSPTVVETPMGKEVWAGKKGEDFKRLLPTRRFAQPEEVAALIAFLGSREASMITGENVLIDGGYTSI